MRNTSILNREQIEIFYQAIKDYIEHEQVANIISKIEDSNKILRISHDPELARGVLQTAINKQERMHEPSSKKKCSKLIEYLITSQEIEPSEEQMGSLKKLDEPYKSRVLFHLIKKDLCKPNTLTEEECQKALSHAITDLHKIKDPSSKLEKINDIKSVIHKMGKSIATGQENINNFVVEITKSYNSLEEKDKLGLASYLQDLTRNMDKSQLDKATNNRILSILGTNGLLEKGSATNQEYQKAVAQQIIDLDNEQDPAIKVKRAQDISKFIKLMSTNIPIRARDIKNFAASIEKCFHENNGFGDSDKTTLANSLHSSLECIRQQNSEKYKQVLNTNFLKKFFTRNKNLDRVGTGLDKILEQNPNLKKALKHCSQNTNTSPVGYNAAHVKRDESPKKA